MNDKFDEARKAVGSEAVDDLMASLGMGPKYVPVKRKTFTCPRCRGVNAYHKEVHADTDMNEIVLYCPDCKFSDD